MNVANKNRIINTNISNSQKKDTGMALTFVCLLVYLSSGVKLWLFSAIVLLLINMISSSIFYFPAIFWFSLANLLSLVSSKILLTLIFFFVITPMGLLRKILSGSNKSSYDSKKDPLRLNQWGNSPESVFKDRNYKYSKKDLINPY